MSLSEKSGKHTFRKIGEFSTTTKKTRQIGNFSRKIAKLPSFPKFFSPKSLKIVELQFDDQFDQKSPNWGKNTIISKIFS